MGVGVQGHEDVWWSYKKEGNDVVVAESRGECWEEVLETCCTCHTHLPKSLAAIRWIRNKDTHICDCQDVHLDIGESQFEALKLSLETRLIDIGLSRVDRESSIGCGKS